MKKFLKTFLILTMILLLLGIMQISSMASPPHKAKTISVEVESSIISDASMLIFEFAHQMEYNLAAHCPHGLGHYKFFAGNKNICIKSNAAIGKKHNKGKDKKVENIFKVTETSPASGDKDVELNSKVRIIFNHKIDYNSVSISDITINGDNCDKIVVGSNNLIVTPLSNRLEPDEEYTVKIKSGVLSDIYGNKNEAYSFSFTTIDEEDEFEVVATNPADDKENVSVYSMITITFSNKIKSSTVDYSDVEINGQSAYRIVVDDNMLRITPKKTCLSRDRTYRVELEEGVLKDIYGNENEKYKFSFTTED